MHSAVVLLVEDDCGMRRCLKTTLTDQHLRVVETETGAEALTQAVAHNPDVVVLDYGLPDVDGLHVTTKLREWSAAPILILSANDDHLCKIAALDAGANDYVTKPFGTGELLARIRALLRLTLLLRGGPPSTTLEIGELKIDHAKHRAYLRGEHIPLTPTQFRLLSTMMRHAGQVLTHEELLSAVWGPARVKEKQYLRVFMGQLRKKLERDTVRSRYLVTEPGVGYRLSLD